jgi:hypothetical protein
MEAPILFEAAVERLRSNTSKYAIIPNYIKLEDYHFNVPEFLYETERMKPSLETVFQSFDKHRPSDRKRKQITGDTRKCIRGIQESVTTLITAAFPDVQLSYPMATTLISLPGCGRQAYHYDFNYDHPNAKRSYACLVALMDQTQFYALVEQDNDKYNLQEVVLKLRAGDVLIFRGDFIHAGSEYADRNVRLHFYFETTNRLPELGELRATNTTYKLAAKTDTYNPLDWIRSQASSVLIRVHEINQLEAIRQQMGLAHIQKTRWPSPCTQKNLGSRVDKKCSGKKSHVDSKKRVLELNTALNADVVDDEAIMENGTENWTTSNPDDQTDNAFRKLGKVLGMIDTNAIDDQRNRDGTTSHFQLDGRVKFTSKGVGGSDGEMRLA